MAARIEQSLIARILVMIWDGFLLIGEGLGLKGRHQRRFADIAWCTLLALLITWFVAIVAVTPAVLR